MEKNTQQPNEREQITTVTENKNILQVLYAHCTCHRFLVGFGLFTLGSTWLWNILVAYFGHLELVSMDILALILVASFEFDGLHWDVLRLYFNYFFPHSIVMATSPSNLVVLIEFKCWKYTTIQKNTELKTQIIHKYTNSQWLKLIKKFISVCNCVTSKHMHNERRNAYIECVKPHTHSLTHTHTQSNSWSSFWLLSQLK